MNQEEIDKLFEAMKKADKKYILEIRPQFVENIVEYDLIRNDDFRNPDQFDLNNQHHILLSFEYKL